MRCYKKVFIFSSCCFIMTVIFGFAAYRSIFEYAIRDQVSLHKRNYVRQFYLKFPMPLDFRVYFFNVTNPEDVQKGGNPILKEVGPYCYDLYKERIDVEDDETEDSLTYTPHDNYIFSQERSGELNDDDYVTIIHPLMMGMVNHIATKSPQFLTILDEALVKLFQNESIYLTAKVKDILFDGMLINCTARDFSAMAVCTQLRTKMPGVKVDGKGYLRYGLLSQKNGTISTRIKVLRGVRDSAELGQLVAVDNMTRTDIWSNEVCNEFRGTDGWIFPPLSGDMEQIWMHPVDFCMNLHADFVEETSSNGISVRKFYSDFEDQCANCSLQKPCLPRGLVDLTECIHVPLYISLPHFLKSDESLLRKVHGLNPDTEKHITRVLLEGTLSLPIEAQIRVQFNFPLQSVGKIRFMQTMPEVIHPVIWVELGVVLNGSFLRMIQAFFYFLTFVEIFKYTMLILSLLGMGYAAYLYLNNKKMYSMKDTIQTALKKRNLMRKFYLKIPIPLDFRVYFFNITNPEEVQKGQTPVVKEIGPYCYDAYKEKIDILDNEGEDSLTYTPYETYFFNQERSANLTSDDYVTILHPLIVGIVNTVAKDSPPLLPIVNKALKSMFNDPQNIYLTTKVRDLLFDGIIINCSSQDFSAAAVCTQIKTQVPDLTEVRRNVFKFSLLGPRNGTLPNRFKILRGIKKSHELGRLVELNHEKESNIWSTKKCNRFVGTDGWIFPPFVDKNAGIWAFTTDLCRSIHTVYTEDATVHGVHVEKYYGDLGDMSTNPAEKCYCPTPRTCLPKGIMDLTRCMGVPIYVTLPHFLRVDEAVQNTVKGLNPVTDEHIVRILIQPLLAVPLEAQKRIQFNLQIQPVKKINFMKTLPTALHPLLWVEEGIILEGSLLKMIQSVFIALKVFNVVKFCLLGISLVGVGYGGFLHYKERNLGKVTPEDNVSSATSKSTDQLFKSEASSASIMNKSNSSTHNNTHKI
ncbi:hypothetical protein Zmor_006796 [Zophobas morio]|uniref:Sensory neuron membrane protein 1 n=1 Tax=Zophobas morio TaxID=2755281 RepID=A0AA38IW27_9CUCU|nr:hypothetical protein Zmor_006796 [Zophobas morio]